MGQKLRNEELNRLDTEQFRNAPKEPLIVVLDNVRSLHNVGSVFRTADAFRLEAVYLCGVTGCPPNKEIEKSALGSTSSVDWKYFPSTAGAISELREKNFRIYAVEQARDSVFLNSFSKPAGPAALVFGNEIYGVEQQVINDCDGVIEIPQSGTKHSLNISVSVGIVLWEMTRSNKTPDR